MNKKSLFIIGVVLIIILFISIIFFRNSINVIKYNNQVNDGNTKKIIYLTFDDGPGKYTSRILGILDEYDVKATFFLTNQFKKYQYLIKEEYLKGHALGVHSYTHEWNIYKSVNDYMYDLDSMNNIIYSLTGTKSKLIRFPGGSSNTVSRRYSKGIMTELVKYTNFLGYTYFDWNITSGDVYIRNKKRLYKNIIKQLRYENNVILMHDSKYYTYKVLEDVIKYGLDNGFVFQKLTVNSYQAHQKIVN